MLHLVEDLDRFIHSSIESLDIVQSLKSAIQYSMFPGGKRLRPKIVLQVGISLGVNVERLYPAAASLEFLHAASLIHDDLPALDNDDYRRGRPSLHRAFPESTAILAADFMIGHAFKLLSSCQIEEISKYAALQKEVSSVWCSIQEGQVLDMTSGSDRPKDPLVIYSKKTAALFSSSFVIPTFFCATSAQLEKALQALGLNFGLLFQVLDDVIDARGEKGRGGQSSDQKNNKETFISTRSESDLIDAAQRLYQLAIEELNYIEQAMGRKLHDIRALIEGSMTKLIET